MMVRLRRASPSDAPSLAVLAERTFRDAFGARNSPNDMDMHCAKYFGPEAQRKEIEERALVTMLAVESGRLVGFSQLHLNKPHPAVKAVKAAQLGRLYVSADWHRRKVGELLMQDAFDNAKGAGADRIWLGVWEHNPKAIAFYRKMGFEPVGDQAFMLGEDRQRDIVMAAPVG